MVTPHPTTASSPGTAGSTDTPGAPKWGAGSEETPTRGASPGVGSAGSGDPVLGTQGNYRRAEGVTAEDRERRSSKFVLRERGRAFQTKKGPRACGRWALAQRLFVVEHDGRASVGGHLSCGMVHLCVVCAARVAARRSAEVADAIDRWQGQDGRVSFVTLTVAHQVSDELGRLLDVHTQALALFRRRFRESGWRADLGVAGDIINWEVTRSAWHGWHPHRHLLLFHRQVSDPLWAGFHLWLTRTWADCVARVSPEHAPSTSVGVGCRLEVVPFADGERFAAYITKDGAVDAALELIHGQDKTGGTSRTPFQLLADAADGDRQAAALWHEHGRAIEGKYRVKFSKGLRAVLGMTVGKSDVELANEDEEGDPITELDDAETALVLQVPALIPVVCDAAERGGADEVHHVLAAALAVLSWTDRAAMRKWARDRVGLGGKWTKMPARRPLVPTSR